MADGRRLLYHPEYVRAFADALREARADLHEMHSRHVAEVAALRRELDEVRAAFDELRTVSLARQRAEVELRGLYRERAIVRARAAERDPAAPLQ